MVASNTVKLTTSYKSVYIAALFVHCGSSATRHSRHDNHTLSPHLARHRPQLVALFPWFFFFQKSRAKSRWGDSPSSRRHDESSHDAHDSASPPRPPTVSYDRRVHRDDVPPADPFRPCAPRYRVCPARLARAVGVAAASLVLDGAAASAPPPALRTIRRQHQYWCRTGAGAGAAAVSAQRDSSHTRWQWWWWW